MEISVVGTGYVGLVTGVGLAHIGHIVTCLDIDEDKITKLQDGNVPIYEPGLAEMMQEATHAGRLKFTSDRAQAYHRAEVIFLAVGTPPNKDGSANLTFITKACEDIGEFMKHDAIVVTKSTVPVGTNDYLEGIITSRLQEGITVQMASNPEFLREGSGVYDFFHGDRIVIGAKLEETATIVEEIYKPLKIPTFKTDVRSAEMIKYASNAFLATKISFINEISNICEKTNANIEDVAYGMGLDQRIGDKFLKAGIGYGGSCFPKDTKALLQIAGTVRHDFELLKAVIEVNNKQQISLVKRATDLLDLRGKQVALLGLAFKPNTDDMREAPSIVIAEYLISKGAIVKAYDPKATENAKHMLPKQIIFASRVEEALQGAEAAFLVTEWSEIKSLPLAMYVELMKQPLLFDGRNCYSLEEASHHEIDYYSIGRPSVLREYSSKS
ncbi:UDP-glucose dehydrogenase family protein [Ectobacillus sp. sgz5001026]|uniref:UDP-glucose dehydrogenase family protein n=1 Tax=Ectobacillus sp. sgz5001026 TaxID=3242473 RepID=UPI0036D3A345